jgi:2-haloacid dehalogenase
MPSSACQAPTRASRAQLLEAYFKLDCYPEVPAVLKRLKATGARVAILSNGSTEMLASAVEQCGARRRH